MGTTDVPAFTGVGGTIVSTMTVTSSSPTPCFSSKLMAASITRLTYWRCAHVPGVPLSLQPVQGQPIDGHWAIRAQLGQDDPRVLATGIHAHRVAGHRALLR